jgi:hypothetical protein
VHFAITVDEAERLRNAKTDEQRLHIIQEEIEEAWDEDWLYQSDKAWDAIHRCLTDGTLNRGESFHPRHLAIFGGEQLYSEDDYIISLISPAEAGEVARSLAEVERSWFRSRYDLIDENSYGVPKAEEDFEYTWVYFEGLREFLRKAAEGQRFVLFTVDQ